jgi:hypothetical protein
VPILGVAHVVCSCSNNPAHIAKVIQSRDHEVAFRDSPKVPDNKKPFLRSFPERHEIVYLRPRTGVGIELISHHKQPHDSIGSYQAVFRSPTALFANRECVDEDPLSVAMSNALGFVVKRHHSLDENLTYYRFAAENDSTPTHLSLVAFHCCDLRETSRLWEEGLRFSMVREGSVPAPWRLITLDQGRPNWRLGVLLVAGTPPVAPCFLDDEGWTCVSIYATRIEECIIRLAELGASEVSAPEQLQVNKKSLRLSFLRGVSGEIIELLQLGSVSG